MKKRVNSKPQVEEENFGNAVYPSLKDIPGYSPERVGKDFFYYAIKNYMNSGRTYYIRCTKEFYYSMRNFDRNEEREIYAYNEHIGNFAVSYGRSIEDEDGEVTVIEYADPNQISPAEEAYESILLDQIMDKVNTRSDKDIAIIKAILAGADTDEVISKMVGLSRSAIQERKQKLFKWIREQFDEEK